MALIKNLENRIKLVLVISSLCVIGCIIISLGSLFVARGMVSESLKKIYVLDGNVPILVRQTTMDESLDVEAKSHVELFHHLFLTLTPDEQFIDNAVKKAMYLIDESGVAQYNTLNENGYYRTIIGQSITATIYCDSIHFDPDNMKFVYYGTQHLERRTKKEIRSIITAGGLRRVPRSVQNPHGLLITDWRTLRNKTLSDKEKSTY